jgi:PAS domain S-box-containing protein
MGPKDLRAAAEQAAFKPVQKFKPEAEVDLERLVQELRVHQIELEMQNQELVAAQLAAEESQREYHRLFESAPAGYLMLDAATCVVRANAAAGQILGAPCPRLVGRSLYMHLDRRDHEHLHAHISAALRAGRAACEVRLKRADGTHCVVRLDISPSQSGARDCLVVLTDMSERERTQLALQSLNVELEASVSAGTAQNRHLQVEIEARTAAESQQRELEARLRDAERLQSMGMLAAGVAHDFNNFLMEMVGNAEVLLHSPALPEEHREPLGMIVRTGRKASELTRQLLMLSGQTRLEKHAVSLPNVVSDSLELLRPSLNEDIRVKTRLASDLPPIAADRAHIQHVVMNVILNAVEALGGSGQINLDAYAKPLGPEALSQFQHARSVQPGPFVVLRVVDTGHGMDAAAINRMFDPFFTTKFTGRGLGLALAHAIVQSHGGAIRVFSQPGHGTSFEIALPEWEHAREPERSSPSPQPKWRGSGPVLLIDDDDNVRRVVARMLSILGFEVTAADGGEQGLSLFKQAGGAFKLVVVDWMMPEMSGDKVLAELRKLAPDVPAILISGYSAEDLPSYDQRVLRVQKPMTIAQLGEAARKALAATAESSTQAG